jgi:predicted kinase
LWSLEPDKQWPPLSGYPDRMTTWVLCAGLPGTGKTTLASALAERCNAAVLDKDRVRAALFPGRLTDYRESQDQLCLRAMTAAAAYLTEHCRVDYIFFDGRTFSTRAHIDEVLLAAKQAGACWRILHVTCSDAVAEKRLAHTDPTHPAQNRDPALYRKLKQHWQPILQRHLQVDTTGGIERAQLAAVEAYLATSE